MFRMRTSSVCAALPGAAWFIFALAARAAPAGAAPLPQDPALARPITIAVTDRPVEKILADLARVSGAKLAADESVGNSTVTIAARECPLRDLLDAVAQVSGLDWDTDAEGVCHLRGPAVVPPPVDAQNLVRDLGRLLPLWMRSPAAPTPGHTPPPIQAVYDGLLKSQVEIIEDGGEVPFNQLSMAAQQSVVNYRRVNARRQVQSALTPQWLRPVECLGIQVRPIGQEPGAVTWQLMVRDAPPPQGAGGPPEGGGPAANPAPPAFGPGGGGPVQLQGPPWRFGTWIPYQPWQPARPVVMAYDGPPRVMDAAQAISQRTGVTVVLGQMGYLPAGDATGNTPEELLNSILPQGGVKCSWQKAGGAYWLDVQTQTKRAATQDCETMRQRLAAILPKEYGAFLAMDPRQRAAAAAAPWRRLWQSLTPEQRKPGTQPVVAAEMTPEQQGLLCAALEVQMVQGFWGAFEDVLSADLQRATVSYDFSGGYFDPAGYGYPRMLRVAEGENVILAGQLSNKPSFLRLLPAGDPALRKTADLQVKDEPLAAVAARLSAVLNAPLTAEEPEAEVKLTANFKDKPVRLLMHWVERHTSLQWSKREGVYVLSAPIPVADLATDPKTAMANLGRGIPEQVADDVYGAIPRAITDADKQAIAQRSMRLADMSPALQGAVREMLFKQVRSRLTEVDANWQAMARLNDAKIRLDAMGGTGGQPPTGYMMHIEVPGMPPRNFYLPNRDATTGMVGPGAIMAPWGGAASGIRNY